MGAAAIALMSDGVTPCSSVSASDWTSGYITDIPGRVEVTHATVHDGSVHVYYQFAATHTGTGGALDAETKFTAYAYESYEGFVGQSGWEAGSSSTHYRFRDANNLASVARCVPNTACTSKYTGQD